MEASLSTTSLVSSQDHWSLLALLLCCAALGLWAESTRLGKKLSGAVITILASMLLSNTNLIPAQAPLYDLVWSYLVPLAIPLLLFKANLLRIVREAGPTLAAFGIGAVGTVLGTLLAASVVPLGPDGGKLAGIFCATYIGGSINYVSTAQALQVDNGGLLAAGMAADNLMMTLYFLVLFALPAWSWLRRGYKKRTPPAVVDPGPAGPASPKAPAAQHLSPAHMGTALAIAAVLCAVGSVLEGLIGQRGSAILFTTALVVALASIMPARMGAIQGASRLGIYLLQVFFAVIGASANLWIVLEQGVMLFVLAAVILSVHLVFLLLAGRLLGLDLKELVIASNANMGGPTTAAAMASARNWEHLLIPAILCGTLGYAVATFIGTALGRVL